MIDGRYRFRTESELVILQVCELHDGLQYDAYNPPKEKWRDAKVEDLLDIEFKPPQLPGIAGGIAPLDGIRMGAGDRQFKPSE